MRRLLLLLGLLAATPAATAETRAVDLFPDPLADYRRMEVIVPAGFTVECGEPADGLVRCVASGMPPDVGKLVYGLRGGATAGLDFERLPDGRMELRIRLKRPELAFRSARLAAPDRWVIEIGMPLLLWAPIEEEVPFQPYPLPTAPFQLEPPRTTLAALRGDTEGARAFNHCWEAWLASRYQEVLERCARVSQEEPTRPSARAARMLVGEAWYALFDHRRTSDVAEITRALGIAEEAATDAVQRARYALLAAEVLERLGYPARAELHLETRAPDYAGTPGAPYLLAGQARLLLQADDGPAARKVLEVLRGLPGDAPTVGNALLALAGMAYEDHRYLTSVGLFDAAKARWPDLLVRSPGSLFQAAELYLMYDRVEEARSLYETFLAEYPEALPHWVVQVRLAQILARTDLEGARGAFNRLAGTLRESEGQDLAFLWQVRLGQEESQRRRILRELRRSSLTDYVLSELLVLSVRQSLAEGDPRGAYTHAKRLWTVFPDAPVLSRAPVLFDRVLLLLLHSYLKHDRPMAAAALYLDQSKRFEQHALRGEMHLLAGRAFRALAMTEEAVSALQRGLGGRTEQNEPDAAARIYLEMAGALREAGDHFRLGQVIRYLDTRHPKRFDDYEYWLAKGVDAEARGERLQARDMYLYALNGPVDVEQRALLAGRIAEIYIGLSDRDRALRALATHIAFLDEAGVERDDSRRRDARWRIAELELEAARWPQAVAALRAFLDEYPDDPARAEAIYFTGRGLLAVGDGEAARRQWHGLTREDPQGHYGRLAARELEMLEWRQQQLPALRDRAEL